MGGRDRSRGQKRATKVKVRAKRRRGRTMVRRGRDTRCLQHVRPPGVEPPASYEDDRFDDGYHNDLFELVETMFSVTVADTLEQRTATSARDTTQLILDCDAQFAAPRTAARTSDHGIGTGETIAVVVLIWWLSRLRDPEMVEGALSWVRTELDPDAARQATRASSLLCSAFDAPMIIGLRKELGTDLIPALTWLAAGAVTRYGGGDVNWLPHIWDSAGADR